MTPTQPVLFAAVGECAMQALAELPRVARDLHIRVAGPFGTVTVNDPDSEVFVSDWQWLSDIRLPAAVGGDRRGPRLTDGEDTLVSSFTSLIRRLRVDQPNIAPGSSPRVRVCAYLIIDLSDPEVIPVGLRLLQLLRTSDPSLDITGLGMTGRTAESQSNPEQPWFDAFAQLLTQLQNESHLQRLYVLDGRDTNNTWLQTLGQMQRLGAEFLLHHGLSPYRNHLRRHERSRVTPEEDFLHACGSFCCRTLRSDLTVVARGIAAEVAKDKKLAHLDEGMLTDEQAEDLGREAGKLTDEIARIYQGDFQRGADVTSHPPLTPPEDLERKQKVLDAIKKSIMRVCAGQPLMSRLKWFLKRFQLALDQLSTSSSARSRVETRYRFADILRRQVWDTYAPTKVWLHVPGTQWRNRYDPHVKKGPRVRVSQPTSTAAYCLGVALLLMGLAAIAIAEMAHGTGIAIGGGLLTLVASAVMALPCGCLNSVRRSGRTTSAAAPHLGWAAYDSTPVFEDSDDEAKKIEELPLIRYRRQAPKWSFWAAAALLAAGLSSLALSLSILEPLLLALCCIGLALLGLVLQRWPRETSRSLRTTRKPNKVGWVVEPEKAGDEEIPAMVEPHKWGWRTTGLLCLAIAWGVLCLRPPPPIVPDQASYWAGLLGGLLLILGGVGLARWPWVGHGRLIFWTYRRPRPLDEALDEPVKELELSGQVHRLTSWVEALLAESESARTDQLEWSGPHQTGTILEALVGDDWHKRAADVFRRTLRTESVSHLAKTAQRPDIGNPLVEMAKEPKVWAECLVAELTNPTVGLTDPRYLLALHVVSGWLRRWTWQDLITELRPDPEQFDSFVTRICSARWPTTRNDPEFDASIIAVGEALWETVAPLAQNGGTHRLVRVDWQDPQTIIVVRVVQGLTGGWRNFDALPTKPPPRAG